jgi:hypothetical protein
MARASTIAPQALQVDMSIATLKELSIANLLWSLALASTINRCNVDRAKDRPRKLFHQFGAIQAANAIAEKSATQSKAAQCVNLSVYF